MARWSTSLKVPSGKSVAVVGAEARTRYLPGARRAVKAPSTEAQGMLAVTEAPRSLTKMGLTWLRLQRPVASGAVPSTVRYPRTETVEMLYATGAVELYNWKPSCTRKVP